MNPVMENSQNYNRIKQAIKYLLENFKCQPSLDELAAHVNMSKFHFQSVFHEWAGISPKQFLSHLTVEALKYEILNTRNLIEASENVGLSSQSRAYDLMVNIESVTPGEFKILGKTLSINYGFAESPFGKCFIATTQRGVCSLQFVDNNEQEVVDEFRLAWGNASFYPDDDIALQIKNKIFSSEPKEILNLYLKGTPFQLKVWRALLSLPFGSIVSYGGLTQLAEAGQGTRAVASAVARNPIGYIIPCHRVIRNEGVIGQYHWGSERKASIIGWEKSMVNNENHLSK